MPQIWAHRGASAACPENTLDAFERAIQMRADGIELDVQLSADGYVMVAHDETVDRVSDGNGRIAAMTLMQLKTLNAAHNRPGYGTARFPTLDEALALLRPTNLVVNIELKNAIEPNSGLEQRCLALVREMRMEDRVWFSSFVHPSLMRVKELAPHMPCGLLYNCLMVRPWEYAKALGMDALHPHYAELHVPNEVSESHRMGIRVHPWTVNDPEVIRRITRDGVDAIITDVPDLARRAIGEMEAAHA